MRLSDVWFTALSENESGQMITVYVRDEFNKKDNGTDKIVNIKSNLISLLFVFLLFSFDNEFGFT